MGFLAKITNATPNASDRASLIASVPDSSPCADAERALDVPMTFTDFFTAVLPSTGPYVRFRSKSKSYKWVDSPEALAEACSEFPDATDIYFGTASFKQKGDLYSGRTQADVAELKSLRLDLDAGEKKLQTQGPEKVYATQEDAVEDLIRFSKDTGFLPSIIVSSGEGLHVYYVMDRALPAAEWKPIAKALQAVGVQHGLKIDSSVTADEARVLRPIGTLHPNGKRVSVLKATGKVYSVAEVQAILKPEPERVWDTSVNDELSLYDDTPKDFELIKAGCEAVRWAAAPENQAQVEEPYWRALLGIVKHCEGADELAHDVSRHHPDYDPEEVRRKLAGWNSPPTLCATFANYNRNACARCKYAQGGTA